MANNRFWTGMVLGGLLGITIVLLANKTGPSQADIEKKKESLKEDLEKDIEKSQGDFFKEGFSSKGINPSLDEMNNNREKEKRVEQEEEVRNTEEETEKKAEKEGETPREEIASKLSFSKKVSQLEEALKKLREENIK